MFVFLQGFYYDAFYGDLGLNDDHFKQIETAALKAVSVFLVFSSLIFMCVSIRVAASDNFAIGIGNLELLLVIVITNTWLEVFSVCVDFSLKP